MEGWSHQSNHLSFSHARLKVESTITTIQTLHNESDSTRTSARALDRVAKNAVPPSNRSSKDMLFRKVPTTSLFERKLSPEKWHKAIDQTANGLLPVTLATDALSLFPWARLRQHTDVFLQRRNLSEVERDLVLCSLVTEHQNGVVALAAVSHLLSAEALLTLLATFASEPENTGRYLQAFVAASHGNSEIMSPGDEAWAVILAIVKRELTAKIPDVSAIRTLFGKWCSSPLPSHYTLRTKTRYVMTLLCGKVNAALESYFVQQDWVKALPIAGYLSELSQMSGGIPPEVQDVLEWELSSWPAWAAWVPEPKRLRLWDKTRKDFQWSAAFWKLLGPSWEIHDGLHPSAMARLLASSQFGTWLEEHGIFPGSGLMKDHSEETSMAFAKNLYSTVDAVYELGGISRTFLCHILLDQNLGLDLCSLKLWQLARQYLFSEASLFLTAVLRGEIESGPLDSVAVMIEMGLNALCDDHAAPLRAYLRDGIHKVVKAAAAAFQIAFRAALEAPDGPDWQPAANSIISFRTNLAQHEWIQDLEVGGMKITSRDSTFSERLQTLGELHQDLMVSSLQSSARVYTERVVQGGVITGNDDIRLIHELHQFYLAKSSHHHRSAAVKVALLNGIPPFHRAACISGMGALTQQSASKLEWCLQLNNKPAQTCRRLVKLAAVVLRTSGATDESWQLVIRLVMELYGLSPDSTIKHKAFTDCDFDQYSSWLRNLRQVFGDSTEDSCRASTWVEQLLEYADVLNNIRALPDSKQAIHSIYTAFEVSSAPHIKAMLAVLKAEKDEDRRQLMMSIVASLTAKSHHAEPVSQAIILMLKTSKAGFELCKKLVVLSKDQTSYITALQLEIWLFNPTMVMDTRKALEQLGIALRLPPTPRVELGRDYFRERIAKVMAKAQELEDMRVHLRGKDKSGLATVLLRLNIDETASSNNALEDEVLELPHELINVVEQVDDTTVELMFPLTHLNNVQRMAMGVDSGENVIVRLTCNDEGKRLCFCVHVTGSNIDTADHLPFTVTRPTAPSQLQCKGKDTRIGYVVSRVLWKRLHGNSNCSLINIHKTIDSAIKTFGHKCLICNHPTKAHLYRPTTCTKSECAREWYRSSLEVRCSDLKIDHAVVGLLLASIHASASSMSAKGSGNSMELLPNRPPRLSDNACLVTLLDTIPSIPSAIKILDSLYEIRKAYSIHAELALSWGLNSYKGFLISATGSLRIPNLPHVAQFVYANGPPDIAEAFAKHDSLTPRKVLFHGTSMDRLFSILCQGLQILSNTSFQSHGAAYGKGIYLAEEPSTAVSYAKATACGSKTFAAQHSAYVNKKVLLGIEYAGSDADRRHGIHVATDHTKLMLRYVFLLPESGFSAPLANHVVPGMSSAIHELRRGTRGK